MIGTHFWAVGVTLTYSPYDQKWTASVEFRDDGFAEENSTEGNLHTRYYISTIEKAIDLVLEDARKIGIQFQDPCLYMKGDGEDPNFPPPDNWKSLLQEQAQRIGWRSPYNWGKQDAKI